jgi:hypothetical protein
MYTQAAEVFPIDDTTIKVAEGDGLDAYWVTTSKYVFFVDSEDGYKLPGAVRKCETLEDAITWAKSQLHV